MECDTEIGPCFIIGVVMYTQDSTFNASPRVSRASRRCSRDSVAARDR